MARKVTISGGKPYSNDGSGWKEISQSEYNKQAVTKQMVEAQGPLTTMGAGTEKLFDDLLSGGKEIYGRATGNDQLIANEQLQRAELQREYQPYEDYGGPMAKVGELGPSVLSAFIPGRALQYPIAAAMGMAENPEDPAMGAAYGLAANAGGDFLSSSLTRIGTHMKSRGAQLAGDRGARIQAGRDQGMEFTPGQRSGNPQRQAMERELGKNPLYMEANSTRYEANQRNLNDLAADYMGVTRQGGEFSPEMIQEVYDRSKRGFKAMDSFNGPVNVDLDQLNQVQRNLSDPGERLAKRFQKEFPSIGKAEMTGQDFNQARNWLAKQSRSTANQTAGIGDDIQELIDLMDASAIESAPDLAPLLTEARKDWKRMLVGESLYGSALSEGAGNVNPATAYKALQKYDGKFTRQNQGGDPFSDAVQSMVAAQDTRVPIRPSGSAGAEGGITSAIKKPFLKGFSEGGLMGLPYEQGADVPLMLQGLVKGSGRGLLQELLDTEEYQQ